MRQSRTLQAALGVYTLLVLVFLYVPIIPPLVLSLHAPDRSGTTLESYTQIGQNPVLVSLAVTDEQFVLFAEDVMNGQPETFA